MHVVHGFRQKCACNVTGFFGKLRELAATVDYAMRCEREGAHLRASISRIGVGGEKEWDVIVAGGIGDAETNDDAVKEGRIRESKALLTEIIGREEC